MNSAILGLRNCAHSSGGLAEKWGQKNKRKRYFNFSAPIFLPVDDAKADKRDQTENCWHEFDVRPEIIRTMRLSFRVRLLLAPLLAFTFLTNAGSAGKAEEKAIRAGKTIGQRDLGVWDDVFACGAEEVVVLRRGKELFTLSLSISVELKKLAAAPAAVATRIIASAGSGDRLWLFLQSDQNGPSVLDAYSGKVTNFDLRRRTTPGSPAPFIRSHVMLRHADAALLMISGDERRSGFSINFWMSLKSGKVVAFPIGWDLDYFSADQRVAVFQKPFLKPSERRPLQAVDMRTGDLLAEIPDRSSTSVAPFNWHDTQRVKPVYRRRPETGDQDHFAGISVDGSVFPIDIKLDITHYLSIAKVKDGFAGFTIRPGGSVGPNSFFHMALKQKQNPQLVATGVADFAMLDIGNFVFVTGGHGRKGAFSEAFFRSARENTARNVLDGVGRLPELDKVFVDKDYIKDRQTIRLIDGFGNHNSLVLCLFSHLREDMRAFHVPVEGKTLQRMTWGRAVILTSAGERYMTDIFHEGNPPDLIWLHNSGKVITGAYLWQSTGSIRERKVWVDEATIKLQR